MSESSTGSAVFVRMVGEFDMADEALFSEMVTHGVVQNGHTTVALECSGLTLIDASGLRALLHAQETETRGASLYLVDPSAAVRKVIHLAGLTDRFSIAPDERGLDH